MLQQNQFSNPNTADLGQASFSTAKTDDAFRRFIETKKVLDASDQLRLTGSLSAGRALINALDSNIEDVALIAGMGLVQAGSKAVPAIVEALDRGDKLNRLWPVVDSLLDGAGDFSKLRDKLRELSNSADPGVAGEAARLLKK